VHSGRKPRLRCSRNTAYCCTTCAGRPPLLNTNIGVADTPLQQKYRLLLYDLRWATAPLETSEPQEEGYGRLRLALGRWRLGQELARSRPWPARAPAMGAIVEIDAGFVLAADSAPAQRSRSSCHG
jgi:hypothetical protein